MFSVKTVNNAAGGGGELTSAPVVVPVLAQQHDTEPETYWPMPGPGQTCQGLRRGALYQLWRDGEIATISLRRKGRARGRRLILASTLRDFLRRCNEEQNPVKENGK